MNRTIAGAALGLAAFATLAAVRTTVAVPPSGATPPSGLTNVPMVRGTDVSNGNHAVEFGTDVAIAQITVNPGGSSGWHAHPGGAIIVVQQGALIVQGSLGRQCRDRHVQRAGQAFIERPGELDDVFNTGTVPYVLFVTFPRIPQGDSPRIDKPDPGTCAGF